MTRRQKTFNDQKIDEIATKLGVSRETLLQYLRGREVEDAPEDEAGATVANPDPRAADRSFLRD